MKEIEVLLNKYSKLHVYIDDAHGMSIAGRNGAGVVLDQIEFHEKMILAVSFAKAFGVGGSAFIFNDEETKKDD